MWSAQRAELHDARGWTFTIAFDSRPASFGDVLRGWREDVPFRAFFNSLLADVPYAEFRWETPPVTTATLVRPFVFVVLNSPGLARRPDLKAFADHFTTDDAVRFLNLGRDAILVVPCPMADVSAYGHLAAFVRIAPVAQRQALWRAVGEALTGRVGTKPVWLNTAGAGVAWLHVRLDDRPKYYCHAPFQALV